MADSRLSAPNKSKSLQRTVPTKRMRWPLPIGQHGAAALQQGPGPAGGRMARSAGQASSSSRPSNSWLPATNSTGTGQWAKRSKPAQLASMSPASTSTSASGAGCGSKSSVSRCRSESSCSFTRRGDARDAISRARRPSGRQLVGDALLGRAQLGRQVVGQLLGTARRAASAPAASRHGPCRSRWRTARCEKLRPSQSRSS